jgi:hypothetical protein
VSWERRHILIGIGIALAYIAFMAWPWDQAWGNR